MKGCVTSCTSHLQQDLAGEYTTQDGLHGTACTAQMTENNVVLRQPVSPFTARGTDGCASSNVWNHTKICIVFETHLDSVASIPIPGEHSLHPVKNSEKGEFC